MLFARGKPTPILAASFAAIVICATGLALSAVPRGPFFVAELQPSPVAPPAVPSHWAPALAVPAALDSTTTGSINPVPSVVPAVPAAGSPGFLSALDQLANGHYADAYSTAKSLSDGAERRTAQWAAIYFGGGSVDYGSVVRYETDAPEFASGPVFKTRLEQAVTKADADGATVIRLLGGAMPNTLSGQIALAEAYKAGGQRARAAGIAREIWIDNFLDPTSEKRVLASLGDLLTHADHWARAQHLMMNDRATAVERLFGFMTPAEKSLAVARNATSRHAATAKKLLDAVDPAMQTDPVYYFSRAQRAHQFKLWDDAISYLDKGKAGDPDAAQWWYERQDLVRQMLAMGDPQRAYKAAAGFTDGPEGRVVEAQFHAGWIALSFLHDSKAAVQHFEAMAKAATLPDSVTQANYWLGRARNAAGDSTGATAAFQLAAAHSTVYYGQLARSSLGMPPVEIRQMPQWQDKEDGFEQRDIVRGINLLLANGRQSWAASLLRNYAETLTDGADLLLAARLAQRIDAHNLAISIADIADKRGVPLDLFSFPKDGLPTTQVAEIDPAAIFAIARQESRFQPNAISSSGARGLMQLMPATAKETAEKIGIAYSPGKLTSDPEYNALLGSTYLARQLNTYDGSLLLAAAAYNAGAGNANKWIAAYGDPRLSTVDPVVWVELIPFQETRKYVQRVLGNYMVYRARFGGTQLSMDKALHHIG